MLQCSLSLPFFLPSHVHSRLATDSYTLSPVVARVVLHQWGLGGSCQEVEEPQ